MVTIIDKILSVHCMCFKSIKKYECWLITWKGKLRPFSYDIRKEDFLDVVLGGNFVCPMVLCIHDMPVIRKLNRGQTSASISSIDDLRRKEIALFAFYHRYLRFQPLPSFAIVQELTDT